MEEKIKHEIANKLMIKEQQVSVVLKLLSENNTIPFIARYRKEMTGGLGEEKIKAIDEVYQYQKNLAERKEAVIALIDEKGLLTEELKNKIINAEKLVEVEDLYRPFKEKKKTKATEAIKKGLEPLAKLIYSFPKEIDLEKEASKFLNKDVKTTADAITGAGHIIAEWISDQAEYRKAIRLNMIKNGIIVTKIKKDVADEKKVYEMYYDYQEAIKSIKSHRILAINRGEKEKVLLVKIKVGEEDLNYLVSKIIKTQSPVNDLVLTFIKDSYDRLIFPSVEREIRSELTEKAEKDAINNFGVNLEKLLLTPPLKEKIILALDPAYRTGCKLAVIDALGRNKLISVIYPHAPLNKWQESIGQLKKIINEYQIDIIAIGNGTASRESEKLIAEVIKSIDQKVEYIIVNEAGASVYSASEIAKQEFPKLEAAERSAISIGRRLQDPLAELVKIDPKNIGVGLYQHDVTPKLLNERLNFVVTKAVNMVGVNINTASSSLLQYVSGLNKKTISKILDFREQTGKIKSRNALKKLLSPKSYEQAIGFLRVLDSPNMLDMTDIHPESYTIAEGVLAKINMNVNDLGSSAIEEKLENINFDLLLNELKTDKYTLEDIIKSLKKPNRDPRDMMEKPLLKSDILNLEDLKIGMKLQGTVRNVVDFGAFIDIGLKNDGLVHISKISNQYLKHPSEVLAVGDIVECQVIDIEKEKGRVALSLLK